VVEWSGTVVLTTPRLLLRTFRRDDLPLYAALNADPEVARYLGGPLMRRLGMVFDHEAEIEDMGTVFQAVVYAITAEQWRSGAAARQRGAR
jgi:hypothetical protein